jgi:hypothetical protein
MRKSLGTDSLTDLELIAVYFSLWQPRSIKGPYKAALKRAVEKCLNQRSINRRRVIFQAGVTAGKSKSKNTPPVYQGERLGSMESMIFYDGVARARRGFKNPYRRDFNR